MSLFWWLPFGTVPELTPTELAELLAQEPAPFLIDVRTSGEFQSSHIPGASHFGLGELKTALEAGTLDNAGRPCIAICLTAHRSIPAVRLLRRHGHTDARQLAGGMRAWWKAGLPTE